MSGVQAGPNRQPSSSQRDARATCRWEPGGAGGGRQRQQVTRRRTAMRARGDGVGERRAEVQRGNDMVESRQRVVRIGGDWRLTGTGSPATGAGSSL